MNRSLTSLRPRLCLLTLLALTLALPTASGLAGSSKKPPKGKREMAPFIELATGLPCFGCCGNVY